MSLREKQQMNLDPESATHTGMDCQSTRSSHKYLLLQVWCGLLTVAMVVMAALLTSIKPKPPEDEVSTLKPNVSPPVNIVAPLMSIGSSLSYIQLVQSLNNDSWEESDSCDSCSLILREDSIHCRKASLYIIYAQVTFSRLHQKNQIKSVVLKRNAAPLRREMPLVEGIFSHTTEGSVWVAKIVKLSGGDSVSINITGHIQKDSTFWGAYQLH